MLAIEIASVAGTGAESRPVQLEPDEEHVEHDAELRDHAERRRDRRRQNGDDSSAPRSDGPSRMPATTSPMTGG